MASTYSNTTQEREATIVEPQEVPEIAMDLFSVGLPLHLQGSPGIGKTYIGRVIAGQLAESQGLNLVICSQNNQKIWNEDEFGFFESNMSHYESEDWMMPKIERKTGKYMREPTDALPTTPNGLFQIDEIAKKPETFRFVAQLMNEGRIGWDYFLPKNTCIMTTSNLTSDRAGAHRLHTDLINRLGMYEVVPTAVGFANHHGEDLNPHVRGFLEWFPHQILQFDPKKADQPFASPRSIFSVSRLMDTWCPEKKTGFDPEGARAIKSLSGIVGFTWATSFLSILAHKWSAREINNMIIDPEGCRTKIDKLKEDNDMIMVCSLTIMLTKRVVTDPTQYGPVMKFLLGINRECAVHFDTMLKRSLGDDSAAWQEIKASNSEYAKYRIETNDIRTNNYNN